MIYIVLHSPRSLCQTNKDNLIQSPLYFYKNEEENKMSLLGFVSNFYKS